MRSLECISVTTSTILLTRFIIIFQGSHIIRDSIILKMPHVDKSDSILQVETVESLHPPVQSDHINNAEIDHEWIKC